MTSEITIGTIKTAFNQKCNETVLSTYPGQQHSRCSLVMIYDSYQYNIANNNIITVVYYTDYKWMLRAFIHGVTINKKIEVQSYDNCTTIK